MNSINRAIFLHLLKSSNLSSHIVLLLQILQALDSMTKC